MKKTIKVWLTIAAILAFIGCILFAGVMSSLRWDFSKLSTVKYETNTYEISKAFNHISMDTDTADIEFAISDNEICKVICYEDETAKHSVMVEDDTLVIKLIDNKPWYGYIGINFGKPKITVYLPKLDYTSLLICEATGDVEIPENFTFKDVDISLSTGDVDFRASASEVIQIKTSTGDICAENISTGTLELSVSTGKITVSKTNCKGDITVDVSTGKTYLEDIMCNSVISSGSTGDISLNNVIAVEKFLIKRGTGDIRFNLSDAAEIFAETDTGDVTGTLLTDKVFITQTDTGNIDVPKTAVGGRCEIITDTGNIKIKIT